MRKYVAIAALIGAGVIGQSAHAATAADPTGDFLPTYTGPLLADLDVTSFSAVYDPGKSGFDLSSSFAGMIDPAAAGFYVIGVNTGTGTIAPFAALGQPNVIFNQAIVVRKDGTGNVGATALDPAGIMIAGNSFSAFVPLSLLPSTGFSPSDYAFNIWPRTGPGNELIADFAPDNANLVAGAVPEPASWAMMIAGFTAVGGAMRSRRSARVAFA